MKNKNKTIFALIGPKGTGKTYTGTLLERELGIPFLNVERLGLENIANSKRTGLDLIIESFDLEEAAIDQILLENQFVSFEGTGAHEYFYIFLDRLRAKYNVKLIWTINERADQVELAWDLILDNSNLATKDEIVKAFEKLLAPL